MSNVPKLRFPDKNGYDYPGWGKRKLGLLCEVFADGDWIETKDQSDTGIRLIQTGNIGLGKYHNKADNARYISIETFKKLKCKEVYPGDILVSRLPAPAGRACMVPDNIDDRLITAVDCTIIRVNKSCIASFLLQHMCSYEYFKEITKDTAGSTRVRISRNNLKAINIPTPSPPEQTKIANFFTLIDKKITKQDEKVVALEEYKTGLMQQIFSREIQFKDDDGKDYPEWLANKLFNLLVVRDERQTPTSEAPLMAFTSTGGVEEKGDRYNRDFLVKNKNKKYKRTELNDLIYSSNNLDVGAIGRNKYGPAVISDVYEIFIAKENVTPIFLEMTIKQKDFLNKVLKYRQGALYGQYRIHANDFLGIEVTLPSLPEQTKIANFLTLFDRKVEKEKGKLRALREQKQGLLQQMFV